MNGNWCKLMLLHIARLMFAQVKALCDACHTGLSTGSSTGCAHVSTAFSTGFRGFSTGPVYADLDLGSRGP